MRLNGDSYLLPQDVRTVEDLLIHLKVSERIVVVERNREVLEKEQFISTALEEGDELEIVHFVGGG
ncbi:thiamine biosynthesis protein ThiS [Paludifilum halophilum]|uniref:Thiamine biosynthesis protein ThiS n=1 Tax=Paludifilum halophilum TaxID=1642702 RepID=A0A235B6C7_9BACL|nr:thiamine biosynthesis protein ThiS [Paludifilum halophilum]